MKSCYGRAIRFVKRHFSITSEDIEAIFDRRKSLLYYNDEPWVKKGESNFNVILSAYDGAEVWELIGFFMLSILSKHISRNHIELYRDDSLAISKNFSIPRSRETQKNFQKVLKKNIKILLLNVTWKLLITSI